MPTAQEDPMVALPAYMCHRRSANHTKRPTIGIKATQATKMGLPLILEVPCK